MTKNFLIITAAFFLIIFASLIFFIMGTEKGDNTIWRCYVEKYLFRDDQTSVESCYLDIAEIKQDVSICAKIKEKETRDSCYLYIAVIKQDVSICEEVEDEWSKEGDCYAAIAVEKEDSSICEKITVSEDLRFFCYSLSEQDASICEKIDNKEFADTCYYSAASLKQDVSICEEIEDEWIKENCLTQNHRESND